jgi:tRNA nucleotidyltransferase (CCA-adding enzyme)
MDNQEKINLSSTIKDQLSTGIIAFMKMVGTIGEKRGMQVYMVGGVVRDLLLDRLNTDLDMVVEATALNSRRKSAPLSTPKSPPTRALGPPR